MRKHFGILALVMILCLAIFLPIEAVKILPYSQPLHDIMHWDAASARLIIQNPEGESQTVSWPATVDLWNYNGSYWVYDLPTGDKFAFDKEILIGSAARGALTFTFGEPLVEVYGTCASTSGTTNAMSMYVHTILSGAGQVGRSAEFVLAPTAQLGGWGNALKGYLDLTGASGSTGLLSGVCQEILLPDETMTGTLAATEWELVAPTSFVANAGIGTNCVSFIYARASGAAVGEIDDHGYFMNLQGLTPDVGHLLSEGYTTLKCAVGVHAKYLVLSRIEDGLGMGASGSALTLSATSPLFQLYTTSSVSAAQGVQSMLIQQTMTVASNNNQPEVLKVQLIADVKTGAWANVIFAQLDYVTDGLAHGAGSVVCAELSLPASSVVRGTYYVWQSEIDVPTGCVMNANPVAVMSVSVWGGAKTQFDDVGLFLDISGVTSGAADFFYDSTVGVVDGFLKCRINGATYYILLADDQT